MLIAIRSGTTEIPLQAWLPYPLPEPRHLEGMRLEAGFTVVESFVGDAAFNATLLAQQVAGRGETALDRIKPQNAQDLSPGHMVMFKATFSSLLDLTRAPFLRLYVVGELTAGAIEPFARLLPFSPPATPSADAPKPVLHPSVAYPSGFAIR